MRAGDHRGREPSVICRCVSNMCVGSLFIEPGSLDTESALSGCDIVTMPTGLQHLLVTADVRGVVRTVCREQSQGCAQHFQRLSHTVMMARVFAPLDTALMRLFCFVPLTWLTQPCICVHHMVSRSWCHNPANAHGCEASFRLKLMIAHWVECFAKSLCKFICKFICSHLFSKFICKLPAFVCLRAPSGAGARKSDIHSMLWHQVYMDEHSMSIMHVCGDNQSKVNAVYLI